MQRDEMLIRQAWCICSLLSLVYKHCGRVNVAKLLRCALHLEDNIALRISLLITIDQL